MASDPRGPFASCKLVHFTSPLDVFLKVPFILVHYFLVMENKQCHHWSIFQSNRNTSYHSIEYEIRYFSSRQMHTLKNKLWIHINQCSVDEPGISLLTSLDQIDHTMTWLRVVHFGIWTFQFSLHILLGQGLIEPILYISLFRNCCCNSFAFFNFHFQM